MLVSHILMKKSIFAASSLASLFIAPLALAQVYGLPTQTVCISVPVGLSYGSRGGSVSVLQSFLVSRNFPGGGSWMVTGYYGRATTAAVTNFQMSQGLFQNGTIDAVTATAISRVSCLPGQGGQIGGIYPSYPA